MALSSSYTEYILDQLAEAGSIVSRRMFGDLGIYVDDVFCAIVGSSFLPPRGMPYYEVPEHVLEDSVVLSEWVSKARDESLRAKKR